MIDLEELERLASAVNPLPWKLKSHLAKVVRVTEHGNERYIADCNRTDKRASRCKVNAAYIVAACNTLPNLIAENRALREKVQKLERQREYLACELSSDDDQADCNHSHLSCEHRKGWLCKAGLKGQVRCWISEAEKFAKEAGE